MNSTLLAACAGFGLTMVTMPIFLAWMRKLGWGQQIREEGPKDHISKAGTPTMGGGVLVPAGLVASLWAPHYSADLIVLWAITAGSWLLGLTDDLTKVFKNRNLGLKARQKLAIQLSLGLTVGVYLAMTMEPPGVTIPWLGFIPGAPLLIALAVAVVTSTTNAVNLTDGLDGLAAGTVTLAATAYTIVCLSLGRADLAAASAGLAGACVAFLWFNCFPARIFMGDTGSLGLGGALACVALLTHTPFLLVVIGGVFVAEAVSVIMQVLYFKATKGKRIFRMSPLHHHFCLGGLHEVQVTVRFCLVGLMLACLGLYLHFGGLL